MLELLAGLVLAAAAVALVLEPLFRRWSEVGSTAMRSSLPDEDPMESDSPKVRALLALKELDFDRATGKLSEEDYFMLKAKYERQALVAIEAEEAEAISGRGSVGAPRGQVECPVCGPRPEAAPVFCSSCGRLLAGELVA